MNYEIALLIVTLMSVASCAAIGMGALILWQRRDNETARQIGFMLFGVCFEIVCATLALWYLQVPTAEVVLGWFVLKIVGRGAEFVGVGRFLRYINAASEKVHRPSGKDAL